MAIFFALLALIGWGVGDIFGTIASRRIGALSTTFWFAAVQIVLFSLFAPLFWKDLQGLTTGLFLFSIGLGFVALAATSTFYEAMRSGNASLAGTIVSSFAALTVILSLIFFQEKINIQQAFSIILIFVGIVILSLDFKSLRMGALNNSRTIIFALISMVCWGVFWAFLKIPVDSLGWYWPIILSLLPYPLIFLFMKARKVPLEKPKTATVAIVLVLNSVLLGCGSFAYNLGIERGLVSIVAPIAGAYSTLFAIIAFFVFRDPLKTREGIGIAITLAGIILLSFFSY